MIRAFSLNDVQRERGEIAVEGVGTMDLSSAERAGGHRIDVRELNSSLHALARLPILSAFRYQRPAGSAPPEMAFAIKRFADAGRSQPFLKVELPPGATIVSVDLAGRSAKPASGADGTRIPLMRAGLPTSAPYTVSFVYIHAGTPFQKKGDIQMALPKMDVPIGVVNWEVFVPEQYSARAIDGNVIDARRFRMAGASRDDLKGGTVEETVRVIGQSPVIDKSRAQAEPPSQHVVNLQARAAGVLPIRVDVPRAGVSHQFIKPLVVGAEATVTLRYKRN